MIRKIIALFFMLFMGLYTNAQTDYINFGKKYSFSSATSIAQDNNGNAYVAGYVSSEFTLKWKSYNQNFYTNNNSKDIYLIKFNSDFQIVWCKLYGGPGDERDPKLTIDGEGNLYVGGIYNQKWNITTTGGTTSLENNAGSFAGFVAKLNKDGNVVWAKALDNTMPATLNSIQITHKNQLLVAGYFNKNCLLKNNVPTLLPEGDKRDYYVSFIKTFDTNGGNLFTKYIEAKNWSIVNDATTDVKNNYYTAGFFSDTIPAIINNPKYATFFNTPPSRGSFIEKMNEKGVRIWRKEIGKLRGVERRYITVTGIATDEDENVYYFGVFRDSVYSGNPKQATLLAEQKDDIILGKLNRSGQTLWMKSLGSAGDDEAKTIFYNSAENKLLIGGNYEGLIPANRFGNHQEFPKPLGGKNIFLAELDTAGNYILTVTPNSNSYDLNSHVIKHNKIGFIFAAQFGHWESGIIRFKPDDWSKYVNIVSKNAATTAAVSNDYEKGYAAYQQKKYTEAVNWFKKAAANGDVEAMFSLGIVYQLGGGTQLAINEKEALSWYEKAATKGHINAMIQAAEIYTSKTPPYDLTQAMNWLKKAADKGSDKAKETLKNMQPEDETPAEITNGKTAFTNQEYTTALEWYKKGAAKGYAEAYYMLGHMYYWGMGTTKNEQEARKWYTKAADKGHPKAKEAIKGLDEEPGF